MRVVEADGHGWDASWGRPDPTGGKGLVAGVFAPDSVRPVPAMDPTPFTDLSVPLPDSRLPHRVSPDLGRDERESGAQSPRHDRGAPHS